MGKKFPSTKSSGDLGLGSIAAREKEIAGKKKGFSRATQQLRGQNSREEKGSEAKGPGGGKAGPT